MDPTGQGRPLRAAMPLQPLRASPGESEGGMWSWAIKREPHGLSLSPSLVVSRAYTKNIAAAVRRGREAEKRRLHRCRGQYSSAARHWWKAGVGNGLPAITDLTGQTVGGGAWD